MRSSHIFYKFFLETTKAILTTVKAEGEEYPIDIHAVCTIVHHFYKKGGDDNNGDFQKDIRDTMPQINKQVFSIIIIIIIIIVILIIIMDTRPVHKNLFLEFPKYPGRFMLHFDI